MKIAFDVQGTLLNIDGSINHDVVALFIALQELGHDMYVWSFGGQEMARQAADDCGIRPTACISKRYKNYDYEGDEEFDLCVDDDTISAKGLDARHILSVVKIPGRDSELFKCLVKAIHEETYQGTP